MNHRKTRVAVGMSGGVDSSLAAALLVDQGYDVTGVHLECWSEPGCRAPQDRKDALSVALQLGIPFQVLDFQMQYKEKVIDYFFREYEAGRTPNPDVVCNREIKFGLFLEWALTHGFDYVATGHYARLGYGELRSVNGSVRGHNKRSLRSGVARRLDRIRYRPNSGQFENRPARASLGSMRSSSSGHPPRELEVYHLLQGVDVKKDQSYFLYTLTQEQLRHVLFPVGQLKKTQVRWEAKQRGLAVADKPDSVGICFVGEVDVKEFLKRRIPERKGDVVMRVPHSASAASDRLLIQPFSEPEASRGDKRDVGSVSRLSREDDYVVVGEHKGVWFYTIGQRHGFSISHQPSVMSRQKYAIPPFYVVGKDVVRNRLIVGFGPETYVEQFQVKDLHFVHGIGEQELAVMEDLQVRIRHGGDLINSKVKSPSNSAGRQQSKVTVDLAEPQRGIAPGQSAVFYRGEECLGGGVIAA